MAFPSTLLSQFSSNDVRLEPFPHILKRDVLPPDLVTALIEQFPPIATILKGEDPGSNKRFDYTVKDIREDASITPLWREFIEAQASKEFLSNALRIFGEEVKRRYPALLGKFGGLEKMRPGIRFIDDHKAADVLLDAHISINTPVLKKPTSVRGVHVDDPKKLFSGLFYLRPQEDKSPQGGNLTLYKYKKGDHKFYGQYVDEKYVEPVETIQYDSNVLIFFLNTEESLHGVSPREVTELPRIFVNLIAEMEEPLFDIRSKQESIWKRRWRMLSGKMSSY